MKNITTFYIILSLFLIQNSLFGQCPAANPIMVTNNGLAGNGSLNWAIDCANTQPALNIINFDLPPSDLVIAPNASGPILPINQDGIIIDGNTQPIGTVVIDGIATTFQNGITVNADNCQIHGLHITNFTGGAVNAGAGIVFSNGFNNLAQGNFLTGNRNGLRANNASQNFIAQMNTIGEDPNANIIPNLESGIFVLNSTGNATIANNLIIDNPIGVDVPGIGNVFITQNQFVCNDNEGINKGAGVPNTPAITSATMSEVSGTSPPNATIEVFINDNAGCPSGPSACQGNFFLGMTVANAAGNWILSGLTLNPGEEVTVTATVGNNTSEFSACALVACVGVTIVTQPSNFVTECAVGTDLALEYQNWLDNCGGGVATSDCDPNITCQSVPFPPPPMPDICGGSVTVNFQFTDGAGNTAISNPVTFTILPDNTPPTITGVPANITVSCDNIPAPPSPSVSDNCDAAPDLVFTENTFPSTVCPQNFTITYVWTASDDCGNFANASQTVTVEDTTIPTFTVPADITITPGTSTDPSVTGDVFDEADNCDPDVADGGPTEAVFSDSEMTVNCDRIITRTWTLTDACGNSNIQTQTITVDGEEPTATFSGSTQICEDEDADLTIELTGTPPFTINYTANGDPQPTISNILSSPYILNVMPSQTTVYEITSVFDSNCEGTISGIVTVTVNANPLSFPAAIFECGDGTGQATFDLTTVENIVNGGTGNNVDWYFDPFISDPIPDPSNLMSASTFIYAIVTENGCVSDLAQVELIVLEMTTSCAQLDSVSMNGGNDGSAVIEIISGGTPDYNYNWSGDNGLSGSGIITGTGQPDTLQNLEAGNYSVTITDNNNCQTTCSFIINEPPPINCTDFQIDTAIINDVTCAGGNDGSLEIILSGGISPFIFEWNDPILNDTISTDSFLAENLSAGRYIAMISDSNNCELIDTFAIMQPDTLNFSCAMLDSVSVNGGNDGSAVISFSGGTLPYFLSWAMGNDTFNFAGSDTLLNLSAGIYDLTLTDANNCSDSCQVEILEPPINCDDFQIDTSFSNNISCFGTNDGSLEIILSGGTPPFIFEWNDPVLNDTIDTRIYSAGNLSAGTYFAIISDENNCQLFDTLIITEPLPISISCDTLVGTSEIGENSGSAILNFDGGTLPYIIQFSGNSDTVFSAGTDTLFSLDPGNYEVILTDANNCSDSCQFTIFEPSVNCDNFQIDTSFSNNISCFGGNDGSLGIVLSGGIPPYTFEWNDPTLNDIIDINNYSVNGLSVGIYSVIISDGNNCQLFDTLTITEPLSIVLTCDTLIGSTPVGESLGSTILNFSGGTLPYIIQYSGMSDTVFSPGTDTLFNLPAGNYEVILTDANNCSESCQFEILTGSSDPCLGFGIDTTQTENVLCFGENDGSIRIDLIGGTPPFQFSWNDPTLNDLTPNNFYSNNQIPAGTYFTTITDNNGCELFDTLNISEPPILQIDSANIQNETCLNTADGSIQIFVSGGTPDYNYNWNNGETDPMISGLSGGDFGVTVTDMNGCQLFETYQISGGNAPTAFFEEIGFTGCEGDDFALTLDLFGTPPFDLIYSDGQNQFNLNGISDGHILNLNPSQSTTYSIVQITDSGNCVGMSSDSAMITVNHPPTMEDLQINCSGNFYTVIFRVESDLPFGVSGNGVANIAPDGTVTSNPISIMMPYEFVVTNDCGMITLEGTDNCDCVTFAGDFSEDTISICESLTACATHSNEVLDNNDLLIFVLQTEGGDLQNPLAQNANPCFDFNAQMNFDTPYYIYAVAGNDNGNGQIDFDDPCLSVVQGPAIIFTEQPPDLLWVAGEEMLCGGSDLNLETEAWSVDNPQYWWLLPNGDTVITQEPNLTIPNVSPQDSGQYFVLMDWSGCLSNPLGFHHLAVNAPPSESVQLGGDIVQCDINSVVINAPSPPTGCFGTWRTDSGADIANPNGTETIVNNLRPGRNVFVWSLSCGACEDAARDTIEVTYAVPPFAADDVFTLEKAQEGITMNVLRNDQVDALDSLEMTVLNPPNVGELIWLPDARTFQFSEPDANFTGTVEFDYVVCNGLIDTCQACDTATVLINILNLPNVPQGLTPNGDGSNDQFFILGLNEDFRNELSIVNRWGNAVFHSDDYSNNHPWDGTLHSTGKKLPQGAYYYQLKIFENGNEVFQEQGVTYIIHKE